MLHKKILTKYLSFFLRKSVGLSAECPNQSYVLISVPSGTIKTESSIIKELVRMVRELIGPTGAFHVAAAVAGLPRTVQEILHGSPSLILQGIDLLR